MNPWSDTRRTSVQEKSRQDFLREASRWREIATESDKERVQAIRDAVANGLTQREVAEAAGVSLGTVNAIVNTRQEIPSGWLRQAMEEGRQR